MNGKEMTSWAEVGEEYTALASYLQDRAFPDAHDVHIDDVSRPAGGQSWEIFLLTVSVTGNDGSEHHRMVVKRAPGAIGPLGPYDVAKEAALLNALSEVVPTPRLLAWSTDPAIFERPFIAMDFVEGEAVDLYRVEQWPTWQTNRRDLGCQLMRTLGHIQRFDWREAGVADVLGPRGSATERVSSMVEWYLSSYRNLTGTLTAPQLFWKEVGAWLCDNAEEVAEEDLVLTHGDLRFGNLLWQGTKGAAVRDWERASLGDRMSDLGFFCVPMARRHRPELMGMALEMEELAAHYEAATSRPVDRRRLQFYMIFWQFVEGSLGSRPNRERDQMEMVRQGGVEVRNRYTRVGKLPLGPNLHVRQIAPVIDAYEEGRHDVV